MAERDPLLVEDIDKFIEQFLSLEASLFQDGMEGRVLDHVPTAKTPENQDQPPKSRADEGFREAVAGVRKILDANAALYLLAPLLTADDHAQLVVKGRWDPALNPWIRENPKAFRKVGKSLLRKLDKAIRHLEASDAALRELRSGNDLHDATTREETNDGEFPTRKRTDADILLNLRVGDRDNVYPTALSLEMDSSPDLAKISYSLRGPLSDLKCKRKKLQKILEAIDSQLTVLESRRKGLAPGAPVYLAVRAIVFAAFPEAERQRVEEALFGHLFKNWWGKLFSNAPTATKGKKSHHDRDRELTKVPEQRITEFRRAMANPRNAEFRRLIEQLFRKHAATFPELEGELQHIGKIATPPK